MLIKILGYSDVFSGELPEYEELVKDIPSEVIIKFLCFINHQLYLNPYSNKVQLLILKKFFTRIPDATKLRLGSLLETLKKDNKGLQIIFSSQYILKMIENELIANRQFDFKDTNADQEHRIFKAYLLIVQELSEKPFSGKVISNSKKDFFYKYIWKIEVNQIDFSDVVNPYYSLIRSIVFLKFLSSSQKVKDAVNEFLGQFVTNGHIDYIMRHLSILRALEPKNPDDINGNVVIKKADGFEHILDWLCIDLTDIGTNPKLRKDFIGLRSKPLIKFQDEYYISHRSYLVDKLFLSLQFDLYSFDRFRNKFSGFQDFRSFVGLKFTEQYFVKLIMEKCLIKNNHQVLLFDEEDERYMPDVYFRDGKNIFLFELKDTMMAADVIESFSFETIKRDIETKFVENRKGAPKGISQLKIQIEHLKENVFLRDDFLSMGIKRRNIRVYPVILYTDKRYGISGVEEYLNDKFLSIMTGSQVFQRIERLVFINVRWFVDNLIRFNNKKVDLKTVIVQHRKSLESRCRKADLTNEIEDFEKTFANFGKTSKSVSKRLRRDDLSEVLRILDV